MLIVPGWAAKVAYDASQEALNELGGSAGVPWEQLTGAQQEPYIAEVWSILNGTADPISPIDPTVGPDNATKADIVFRAVVNALRGS
jgi:hypothetical protein